MKSYKVYILILLLILLGLFGLFVICLLPPPYEYLHQSDNDTDKFIKSGIMVGFEYGIIYQSGTNLINESTVENVQNDKNITDNHTLNLLKCYQSAKQEQELSAKAILGCYELALIDAKKELS